MAAKYPALKIRKPFARGRAVLYEDYLAIEHVHSFGMTSEDSRTYYDEVRWVMSYQKRDWYRAAHAVLLGFPLLLGVLLLFVSESWIATSIGLGIALPCGALMLYSAYRLIFVPRGVASLLSSRGTVQIGTDWPKSANPQKDAGKFFEALLGRLKLVPEFPPPPASPAPVDPVISPAAMEPGLPPTRPPSPAAEHTPPTAG
jgi:hypothetical protein